jgi:class 3 adenylate cyclase/tetratricopeptide (TPR) repeat protein
MAAAPGGDERKIATVLFADLAGSTALADREDPERVRARLERFYEAMQAEIALAGGTTEKFAGDAVMAVFGAPAAQEDHAERALHAALAMQRRQHELFAGELALRIGVNTGDVVAGTAREGSSFVSGDAVNVAARLEQAAGSGEVLVGERTVAAVRGAFEFDDPQSIDAKGKPDGVRCRRLVRALSLQRPRGVSGLAAAFVGRDEELAKLQSAYEQAVSEGTPRLALILGDPGVGKTRLVRELWQWLAAREPQPLQRTGRCLSYGQITYWALGEILKEQLGLLESDAPEAATERLQGREILGLALGLDVAGGLHPLVARDRFQDAWAALLEELCAERPVALLVEDLHWAEEALLDVLEHLLTTVRGPLLLIGTARPELHERRPGFRATERIALEPFSADASERLVAGLLGAEPPAELLPVVGPAEGNPFFVEEVLASLLDRGLLEQREGGWVLREQPGGLVVPDTVQAVVAARIDLLEPAEKAALQAASLIGRVFWSGPVYELLEGLQPDLHVLEERDFIRRRHGSAVEGEREYAVKHAVTREVAYASIPKAKRARLHAAFAAWLDRFGGGRDEHAPLLAHHYAEAVRPEDADLAWAGEEQELQRLGLEAIRWLERAAELAIGRYDIDDALQYLHRALELGPDASTRSAIWRTIGHANALKFDGPAFWEAMQTSLETCENRATCGETYSLLAFHTAIRAGMWKRRPEQELVDGWIDRALELTEPGSSAYVQALIARGYWHWGDATAASREASALAEKLGDPELRSYAWMARAEAAFDRAEFEEACMWAQRRFDLVGEITDPDHIVEMLETGLPATAALGRFREARRMAREHVERSRRLTPHHRVHGISLVVEAEELAGCWEAIRDESVTVEEVVAQNLDTPCIRNARSLLVCALAHLLAGDDARAAELEEEADELDLESPMFGAPRIRLALARAELGEVERFLASPVGMRSWSGLPFEAARLDALGALRDRERVESRAPLYLRPRTYLEPFALRALGIVRQDQDLLAQANARFDAFGLEWHRAQTDVLVRV